MRAARRVRSRHARPPAGKPRAGLIGPGRLILVVGASGAGKDTLIDGARAAAAGDPSFVFPRRVITRPRSDAEDHDTLEAAAFARAVAADAFALHWEAHGNRYAIPSPIDDDIRLGRTVVCNVSRTIVGAARKRYSAVIVVEISAPKHVLHARLKERGRADDGDLARRLERSAEINKSFKPDIVIRNARPPEAGVRRLLRVIRAGVQAASLT
jgi:ribose 1,5-bisphosphokinase